MTVTETRYVKADTGRGTVRVWLRLEGAAVLALAVLLYARTQQSWPLFALLFLAPDISLVAYLAGPRVGATIYNLAHSHALPLAAAVVLVLTGMGTALPLIWIAHIGFDRLLGYGLKYPDSFSHTHLGPIGRARPDRRGAAGGA